MAQAFSEKKAEKVLGKDNEDPELLQEKGIVYEGGRPSFDISVGVSKDGVKLHPQPTTDPLDPLNWSWMKKHTILAIVMYMYGTLFLSTKSPFWSAVSLQWP